MKTRLFVSRDLINGDVAVLEGDRARYLGRVLRLRVGDEITIFDGTGPEWSATIDAMTKSTVTLQVGDSHEAGTESPLKIHLVQGISRGERMDFVVQKATELGVKRITPVMTEYGVVKLDSKRAEKRRLHWQGVAASACEQSGRIRPPLVDTPMPLNDWHGAAHAGDATRLVLRPGAARPLSDVETPDTGLCLLVGPEGGFSEREYDDAAFSGFEAVTLGPRILRTETAAVAAIAIAQALWGDL